MITWQLALPRTECQSTHATPPLLDPSRAHAARPVTRLTQVDATFVEVADRVWVQRREWLDVNVTLVGGERGLVLVDTHGSSDQGRAVVDAVRALGAGDVVSVVNTHWHFDHSFGNAAVASAWPDADLIAHEAAAAELTREHAATRAALCDPSHPHALGHHEEVARTDVLVPTTTFSSVRVVELGDRLVEVLHPGRGHTAGDAVVRVPDADVLVAGDLVEESGPPAYGDDSYPLEWPRALDLVLQLLGGSSTVVPGHGALVDRDFVQEQRAAIGVVAETVRHLAASGVPVSRALAEGTWPYPAEHLGAAVARAYAHLPRDQKRLPLL